MTLALKRKKEGKTNYRKRLELLKSEKLRLVIRKTNKNIIIQITEYHADGDKVLVSANSKELEKLGWKRAKRNLPAAYLTGALMAKKAQEKKIKEAILDMAFYPPIKGNIIYAALKGVIDGGLDIPHSEEVFPSEERIRGDHIKNNDKTKYTKSDKDVKSQFEAVKSKLIGK